MNAVGVVVVVTLCLLLSGSILYFKERMLFIDGPHLLFRIINDQVLQITEFRYGSFISQLFPLLGSKMHVSLGGLMILYSASFYLFYTLVVVLLVFLFRNYGLAVLFGLYLTLFVSDTYFWPNNEIHQGIGWLMLSLGINFHFAQKKWPSFVILPLFAGSIYLAIWTHPLVMMAAIYLWVFLWLRAEKWPFSKMQAVLITLIILVTAYLKFHQGLHHGYDNGKIETVTKLDPSRLKTILASPQLVYFAKSCVSNYWLFVCIFIAGMAALIKERKFAILAWTVLFSVGYLVLICITYWDLKSERFYVESEYAPLSIICSAPFVYYLLPKLKVTVGMAIVSLIFVIRIGYMCAALPAFHNRVFAMEGILAKMKEKHLTKVIIAEPAARIDSILIMNWGAPVESILLSHLHGDKPQRTFVFMNADQMKYATASKDTLLGCWEKRSNNHINREYFQMDTSATYEVMSYEELVK